MNIYIQILIFLIFEFNNLNIIIVFINDILKILGMTFNCVYNIFKILFQNMKSDLNLIKTYPKNINLIYVITKFIIRFYIINLIFKI